MPPELMTVDKCREIHDEMRDREERAHARIWQAITGLQVDQGKLMVRVGIICGGIAGLLSAVPSLLALWLRH